MKLYHGSPKKLKILKPNKRFECLFNFESNEGIFLTRSKKLACLYALGKTLKGKTKFGFVRNKLIIVGDKNPNSGYVYEVEVRARSFKRNEYIYNKEIKDFKIEVVKLEKFKSDIIRVESLEELKEMVRKDIKRTLKIAKDKDFIKELNGVLRSL